jgi:hypothetical protein
MKVFLQAVAIILLYTFVGGMSARYVTKDMPNNEDKQATIMMVAVFWPFVLPSYAGYQLVK